MSWANRYRKTDTPAHGGTLEQHRVQLQRATDYAQAQHERLIAAGAVWDGMDGYAFPGDVTADELERIMGGLPAWTKPEPTP